LILHQNLTDTKNSDDDDDDDDIKAANLDVNRERITFDLDLVII